MTKPERICGDCGHPISGDGPCAIRWVGNDKVYRCRSCTRAMLAKCEVQTFGGEA